MRKPRVSTRRLRHLAEIRISNVDKKTVAGQVRVRLCNYTDVYYHREITLAIDFMEASATSGQLAAFHLRPGDVLLTKDSETADDIGVSAVVKESASDLVCGYHLALIRPRSDALDGRYLRYALSAAPARAQMAALATGITRYGLRSSAIGDLTVPVPTVADQRAIADYLDHHMARLDALVDRHSRLAELADQRFAALIDHEFLGRGWSLMPLRRLLREPPKYGAVESGEQGDETWPRYIRITDIQPDGSLRRGNIRRLAPNAARPYSLRDGDLLFARSGTVGKAFLYRDTDGPACFAGYLIRMRPDPAKLPSTLMYFWTQSSHYWQQLGSSATQATIENVNAERYQRLAVPVPPPGEHAGMIRRLEAAASRRLGIAQNVGRQIGLLHERRRALVTAAITGQLDIPTS